jgi:hypothetical protein
MYIKKEETFKQEEEGGLLLAQVPFHEKASLDIAGSSFSADGSGRSHALC